MKRPAAASAAASPPAPPPQTNPVWNCEALELKPGGEPGAVLAAPITVGQKFLLNCAGPEVAFDASKAQLQLPKQGELALRLLEARALDANHGAFVATTYQVGEWKLEGASLVDGKRAIALSMPKMRVASVIKKEENPEMKPYPPPPPGSLAYPAWVWLGFAGAAAVAAAIAGFALAKSAARRRFAALLASRPAVGSPYATFNKEMRSLGRRHPIDERKPWSPDVAREFAIELDQTFRWYLARTFGAPFVQSNEAKRRPSISRALKAVARRERSSGRVVGRERRRAIARACSELERALAPGSAITMTDGSQLAQLCRKTADALENSLRAKGYKQGLMNGLTNAERGGGWRRALRFGRPSKGAPA